MARIKDVADAAGVSTATVSRVLSNHPNVRAEVRERVVAELGVDAPGPVFLLAHLRTFGHCFNPLAVYWCTDAAGEPSAVDHENWSFFIVDRDGRLAARVRDRNWAARKPVPSLDHFAYDHAWRIEAEWQSLSAPRKICLLYTSPSPRDRTRTRMPSSA